MESAHERHPSRSRHPQPQHLAGQQHSANQSTRLSKWVRINMTMAENLVIRVDHAAKELGMSRSGFLAEAARRMIGVN
jgi:hypothetical protein